MHADLVAVEQLEELLPSRPAGQAAGMDLSSGKKSPMTAGGDFGRVVGGDGCTADMQADGSSEFALGNQGKAKVCRAFCHTLPPVQVVDGAGFSDGGEGVQRELGADLYDTLGRSKFIHIAPADMVHLPISRTRRDRPQKKERAARVEVLVVGPATVAAWGKSLLGREKESGAICAVRLKRHGAKGSHFTVGQRLICTPVGPHEFEYQGGKAA